jgi:hypothetical protein
VAVCVLVGVWVGVAVAGGVLVDIGGSSGDEVAAGVGGTGVAVGVRGKGVSVDVLDGVV